MNEMIPLKKYVDYADGSVVSKTLSKKETGSLTLFAFDQGQGLSTHSAPFDAAVQVVEGVGDFTVGDRAYRLAEGELLIMPAGIPHSVIAEERFKMLLIMIKS